MYDLRNVLTQAPDKVKNTVLSVLAVGVIVVAARGFTVPGEFVASIGIAVERVLDLFYVAPIVKAQTQADALTAFENVKLKASADSS